MKRGQRIEFSDEHDDDFGATSRHVNERSIDDSYSYEHGFFWRLLSAFLYFIVVPMPALLLMWLHGLRFRNRAAIRRAGGCYIYGNHTHWMDVFVPYLLAFPRRAYIVTGPVAVSVPLVRHLVPMLGGIPLNSSPRGKARFRAALDAAVRKGCPVAIFPEQHEWPWYNGIRDFSPYSFTYPVRTSTPVVGYVLTYRRRRLFSRRPPQMTVTVGQLIPPEAWAGAEDPKQAVRDRVHAFMCDTVEEQGSYAWVDYELAAGERPPGEDV